MLARPSLHRRLLLAIVLGLIALPLGAGAEEPVRVYIPAGSSSTLYFQDRPMRIETNEALALTSSISGSMLNLVLQKADKNGPDARVKLYWEERPEPPVFDGLVRRRLTLRASFDEIETGHGEF